MCAETQWAAQQGVLPPALPAAAAAAALSAVQPGSRSRTQVSHAGTLSKAWQCLQLGCEDSVWAAHPQTDCPPAVPRDIQAGRSSADLCSNQAGQGACMRLRWSPTVCHPVASCVAVTALRAASQAPAARAMAAACSCCCCSCHWGTPRLVATGLHTPLPAAMRQARMFPHWPALAQRSCAPGSQASGAAARAMPSRAARLCMLRAGGAAFARDSMETPSPSKEQASPRTDPLEDGEQGRPPPGPTVIMKPRARGGLRRSHSFNPPASGLPDLPALQVRLGRQAILGLAVWTCSGGALSGVARKHS